MIKQPVSLATLAVLALVGSVLAQTPAPTQAPAAPPPAPVTRPPDGPPLLSEDFESGAVNWAQILSGAATIKVVQNRVAHGRNAVEMHYPAGSRGAWACQQRARAGISRIRFRVPLVGPGRGHHRRHRCLLR